MPGCMPRCAPPARCAATSPTRPAATPPSPAAPSPPLRLDGHAGRVDRLLGDLDEAVDWTRLIAFVARAARQWEGDHAWRLLAREHPPAAYLRHGLRIVGEPNVALSGLHFAVQLEGQRAAGRKLVGLETRDLPAEVQQPRHVGEVAAVAK